jgi:tyrosine-protein phosphatase
MQTSPRSFVPMPSFGAVFGEEAHNKQKTIPDTQKTSAHGSIARPASSGNPHSALPFSTFHLHRDSRDSTSTASSDNSPTTTISTMDSSTVTEPSPGPSPESPVARLTTSSFVSDFRSRRMEASSQNSYSNTFFELARPTTPAKKPRNLKNLGINTSSSLGNLRSTHNATTLVVEKREKNTSAPASPSFIKPPTPPKRRPSNLSLTISTPGSNETKPMRLIIPSTPAAVNRPALRHFQSSPSLHLSSPSMGPSGGMHFPILKTVQPKPSALSEVPYEMEEEEDQEPNFDIPQSREEKPAAYPNGPIEIYPSGIFLYCEPTLEQACNFDVIINVASEVKNPLTTPSSEMEKDINKRRIDGPAAENPDFAALSKRASGTDSAPPTPKAAPVMQTIQPGERIINGKLYKTPEYIHIPWEHNTDIVTDLYKLVRTMDDRVQHGKRILVHCQCGVSRSASLIVAYGIYKNPEGSVQDTYDVVKKRSKWIGPNMSLIMQLQEYRNTMSKTNDGRSFLGRSFGPAGMPTGISTSSNRPSLERNTSSAPRTPRTAPLPPGTDMDSQRASTGHLFMLSPGPLSAPSGSSFFEPGFRQSWAASQTQFDLSPKSSPKATPYVDPAGHIIPILSDSSTDVSDKMVAPAVAPTITPSVKEPLQLQKTNMNLPNFSRQLPLRSYEDNSVSERPRTSPNPNELRAPPQHLSFGALRSPAVPNFSIPSFGPDNDETGMMSPTKTSFNLSPWPSSQGYNSQSSPTSDDMQPPPPPLSPRSTGFHMAGVKHDNNKTSFGMFSPRTSTFNIEPPSLGTNSFFPRDRSSQDYEVTSPVRTEFPSDMFGPANEVDEDITSPRGVEFHMTPLKPKVEDEDPFGLTSPTRFGFPSDLHKRSGLTAPRPAQDHIRRPSFQAILPPSHLAQPETSNGFASLNGTAQVIHTIPPMIPEHPKSTNMDARMDAANVVADPAIITHVPEPVHGLQTAVQELPNTPRTPAYSSSWKPTPPREPGLRTRFSSPNMREQRHLHKLQTEIEAKLPNPPAQAVDDLDALMSPRAEEFTRNPFHFNLTASVETDDHSPASSNGTVKGSETRTEWPGKPQWIPPKPLDDDPRSPVQTGSNPIVRNIWDVL